MVYTERNVWSSLIVSIFGVSAYIVFILQRAAGGPLAEVEWVAPMLWTIGLSIALAILVSILWGIFAGLRDPSEGSTTDVRDRDIAQMGNRVGSAFLVIAGIGVIVLCAVNAASFWIAHTMFIGFALSAIVGGFAQVIAYRRGLI
ncbi:hypothetical protein [Leucobacter denitrificans]|uniref:DUF2178 domain-containing protein n=1 Tax=Leucobacter denitrificans TaxID=683042 RepID=A0A7G9S360_9MICO|nr:hypothetical protein [Leucobacter denitrificans]QNN62285.1 hypothetical protein H9L06_08335 [Leucobacter denitrificans]